MHQHGDPLPGASGLHTLAIHVPSAKRAKARDKDDRATMTGRYTILPDRALIGIEGPDAHNFLQGIITNDVTRIGPDRAIYAALLTPQGKFLHEFIMAEMGAQAGETLLVDCEAARRDW